jgi:chemotaxis protein histidine kinase CheA
MADDEFAERLTGVRRRFAAKLPAKLAEIDSALPQLTGEGGDVAAIVYATHRKVHDLCGIGPTLGFETTGRAARVCERVLFQPSRDQRALTEQEMAHLQEGLVALRAAAEVDIQSTGAVPE